MIFHDLSTFIGVHDTQQNAAERMFGEYDKLRAHLLLLHEQNRLTQCWATLYLGGAEVVRVPAFDVYGVLGQSSSDHGLCQKILECYTRRQCTSASPTH